MPPKKKMKTVLAPDDGTGAARKWIPVDDGVAARAQGRENRMIKLADEAEEERKQSAQRERLAAEMRAVKHGALEDNEEDPVQFDVTVGSSKRQEASEKKPLQNQTQGVGRTLAAHSSRLHWMVLRTSSKRLGCRHLTSAISRMERQCSGQLLRRQEEGRLRGTARVGIATSCIC